MKKHKAWKTVVLLFIAAFLIIGPLSNFKDDIVFNLIALIIGILIVAGVVLSWLSRLGVNIKLPRKAEKAAPTAAPTPAATVRPTMTMRVSNSDTDDEFNSTGWKYEYTNVGLYRPKAVTAPMPPLGECVVLIPDPENPYDSGAVKALYDNETVGYMNRGKLQDMIRDKFGKAAICTKVTRADDKLEIWIGID